MTNEPIDFEAARERREMAEIDADQVDWEILNLSLLETMVSSEKSDRAVTSATLRALLDFLTANDAMTLEEAKQLITSCLRGYIIRLAKNT